MTRPRLELIILLPQSLESWDYRCSNHIQQDTLFREHLAYYGLVLGRGFTVSSMLLVHTGYLALLCVNRQWRCHNTKTVQMCESLGNLWQWTVAALDSAFHLCQWWLARFSHPQLLLPLETSATSSESEWWEYTLLCWPRNQRTAVNTRRLSTGAARSSLLTIPARVFYSPPPRFFFLISENVSCLILPGIFNRGCCLQRSYSQES